jgi:hypothetical protein
VLVVEEGFGHGASSDKSRGMGPGVRRDDTEFYFGDRLIQ